MFSNIFNSNSKKTTTINLARNVKLIVAPTVGGVHATIVEITGVFERRERAFFATCDELVKSLKLSDEHTIALLEKAF